MFRFIRNAFLNLIEGRSSEEVHDNREFFREMKEKTRIRKIPLTFVGWVESEEEIPTSLKERECVWLPEYRTAARLDGKIVILENEGIQGIGTLNSKEDLPKTARPGFGYYVTDAETGRYGFWLFAPSDQTLAPDDPSHWVKVTNDASDFLASTVATQAMLDSSMDRWS